MNTDMFMKMTGWLMVVLGVILGVFCLISLGGTGANEGGTPPTQEGTQAGGWPLGAILGPFALIALAGGAYILLFGGRGGIRTRNPAVRN